MSCWTACTSGLSQASSSLVSRFSGSSCHSHWDCQICLTLPPCLTSSQSLQCLNRHLNFEDINHQQWYINRHISEILNGERPSFFYFWASVLKISTSLLFCCAGNSKDSFISRHCSTRTIRVLNWMFKKLLELDIINPGRTWNHTCMHARICWEPDWLVLLHSANLWVNWQEWKIKAQKYASV